jgi:glutamate racemase
MNNDAPIGFFDSGLGGLSIFKAINNLLPNENTIYIADSKNAPYGEKGKDKIIELSVKNTEFLLAHGAKIIVVACNTATTNAIEYLRNKYTVPFIGIEPATKVAAKNTKTNNIGVLATKGTLSSEKFLKTSEPYRNNINFHEKEGTGLVELIEQNKINDTIPLLKKYLMPMLENNIDHLVLGCTHYPFLIPEIQKIIPDSIKILEPGQAVAKHTKNILENYNLLNTQHTQAKHEFYSNSDLKILDFFIRENLKLQNYSLNSFTL